MKKSVIIGLLTGFALAALFIYIKSYKVAVDPIDIIASDVIKKDSEYKLVFFGYAGCYHFCDPRLRQIDPIYKELKKSLDLKMLFVEISAEATDIDSQNFVKDVNSEFEAVNPDPDNLKVLQKQFKNVYVRKMPEGEYLHSGFLYLLKKYGQKYYILKIYTEFTNSKAVIADIKKLSAL